MSTVVVESPSIPWGGCLENGSASPLRNSFESIRKLKKQVEEFICHILEIPLLYMDRRLLTYLATPSPGVISKKIDPWSSFAIPGPPCSYRQSTILESSLLAAHLQA